MQPLTVCTSRRWAKQKKEKGTEIPDVCTASCKRIETSSNTCAQLKSLNYFITHCISSLEYEMTKLKSLSRCTALFMHIYRSIIAQFMLNARAQWLKKNAVRKINCSACFRCENRSVNLSDCHCCVSRDRLFEKQVTWKFDWEIEESVERTIKHCTLQS